MSPPKTSQNSKEFAQLLKLYIDRKPKKVLEIGTHEGGTFYYWLRCATPNTIVGSIDEQRIEPERYNEWLAPGADYNYITCKSNDLGAYHFAKELGQLDWLFIDGGHSYDEIKHDFETYSPLVVPGGIIALHDIYSYSPYNSSVDYYWAKIKRLYQSEEILEFNKETGILGPGIGVIFI